jgi:hypothetical protein
VQLPIRIGDYIGLDCCFPTTPGAEFFVTGGAATRNEWQPKLADGGAARAPSGANAYEIALNAEINPTSIFALGVKTRNKKKGTATLTATVPNPGELTGAGKGVEVASAAATSKKVKAPGSVKLLIQAKGKKLTKLNSTGTVKVTPKITYTPRGGEPATESVKVKLKKKL